MELCHQTTIYKLSCYLYLFTAPKTEQRAHLELGSAALADTEDFATAAQGELAASAVQPEDLGSSASHASTDYELALPRATAPSLVLTSTIDGGKVWEEQAPGGVTSVAGRTGDITLAVEDISGLDSVLAGKESSGTANLAISNLHLGSAATHAATDFDAAGAATAAKDFAIQRANHTGTQDVATITETTVTSGEGLDLVAGLLAHWKLDEESGNRLDSSSNHYDLTPSGDVMSSEGKIGNAAYGAGAKLVGPMLPLGGLTEFTVAFWIDGADPSYTTLAEIMGDWYGGTGPLFIGQGGIGANRIHGAATIGVWVNVGSDCTVGDTTPRDVGWRFVAIRFRGGIDISIKTNDEDWITAATSVAILHSNHSNFLLFDAGDGWGFPGGMDSTSIWSRALSDDEVAALYNAGDGLDYESFSGGSTSTVKTLDFLLSDMKAATAAKTTLAQVAALSLALGRR